MKSIYITRQTAQKLTGLLKEELIELIEREVIIAERRSDKSWKVLRSSVEDYLKIHPKMHRHRTDTVSALTAAKQIGCKKERVIELINSDELIAHRDEEQRWRISCESLDAYILKVKS